MSDPAASLLTIDLNAVAENYHRLQALAASPLAPVVKADGYGLGAAAIARRLAAEGARSFFVARVAEGERLRLQLGPLAGVRIFVLDGAPSGTASRLADANLIPVLSTLDQISEWIHAHGSSQPAALHLDTGLNRLGVSLDELGAARRLCASARIDLIMSHLACAGSPRHPMNGEQAARFRNAASIFPGVETSLANTDGVFLGSLVRSDLARPGLGLYGSAARATSRAQLRITATLTAPIVQLRSLRAGDKVGYGAAFTAAEPMQIGVLAAGYADGVLRAAGGGGYGWYDGRPRPFIGRLSMDLIALDLTGCPNARAGDRVELFGEHVALEALARQARTIPYEILVRSAARAPHRVIGRR